MLDDVAYRLRDLRVLHGARLALDLAELEIPRSRVTAIAGPNGAGKTTLLRVLALVQPPSAGTVQFYGAPVTYRERELATLRQSVTLVAQMPLLFRRSVRANVAYGLRSRRRGIDESVDAALAAVGLTGFADRPAWRLSGGEAQRVAIARALAIEPLAYLFDEPTANIDRQHIATVESLIRKLRAEEKTVVLTTHSLEQAYRLSDSMISLADGRLTPFPLVNVLRGSTARLAGTHYFVAEPLHIEMPEGSTACQIAIDPQNIIISREPLYSSARNCFPGRIVKVEHDAYGVLVTTDCGQPLVARITRHSYKELTLNVGLPVYVTFKSSAIHILDPTTSEQLQAES